MINLEQPQQPLILPRNSEILRNSFIDKNHVLNGDKKNQLILIQQKATIHMAQMTVTFHWEIRRISLENHYLNGKTLL